MRNFSLILLFVSFLSGAASAQAPADKISLGPRVKFGKLHNGLTYYIQQNPKPEKRAELRLVVNAGSVQEKDNQLGIAHFVEHMAFNGTTHFPKNELLNYLQKAGVRFGADLNATTSFDFTLYMLPIPTDQPELLEKGYQVLRDWAGGVVFDKDEIEKERGIIIEEKRMRQNANQRMLQKFLPPLTNNSKYGQRLPIGREDIINTAPRPVFLDYYTSWYRPNNMAVIIVGDVDPVQAETMVRQLFGDLKNPAAAPARVPVTPINWHSGNKALVAVDKEMINTQVSIYFDLKRKPSPDTWAAFGDQLKNEILSQLFSDHLQESFVDPTSPISGGQISPQGDFLKGYHIGSINAVVKTSVDSAIHYMVGEVKRGQQYGFTEAAFQRAKKQYFKRYEEALLEKDKTESVSYVGEYVEHFLNQTPAPGIEAEYAFVKTTLDALTLAEMNQRARAISLDKPVFILCNATEAMQGKVSEAAMLAAFDRAKQQKVEALTESANTGKIIWQEPARGRIVSKVHDDALASEVLNLSNGITVIYKKTDFKNDEVVMRGTQWGGLTLLSDQEVKLANYLPFVGGLGVGQNKSTDLNKILSGVTAGFGLNVGPTQLFMGGRTTVVDLEKFFQLMYMRITDVNWDQQEFSGIKTGFGSQIGMLAKNPGIKFNDTLNKFRYAGSNRITGLPSLAEIDAMSMQDLQALYTKICANLGGTVLVFSGNIPEQAFLDYVELYVASIPTSGTKPALNPASMAKSISGDNAFSFRMGKENKSEINFSYYGKAAEVTDKDVLAFNLLTDILQIKATQKLREEMGSTYSPKVGGSLQRAPIRDFNLNLVVSSLPENTDKIINAFKSLTDDILRGVLTDEDLQKAKAQRLRVVETAQKTNDYWTVTLEQQFSFGMDRKQVTEFTQRLEAMTKEDVLAVARKLLQGANTLKAVMNPE